MLNAKVQSNNENQVKNIRVCLQKAMESVGCYQLVFSSSCCVYGDPESLPITEDHPTGKVTNVYGRTKYFIEEMLKDLSTSNKVNLKTLFCLLHKISCCDLICRNGTLSASVTSTRSEHIHQALL